MVTASLSLHRDAVPESPADPGAIYQSEQDVLRYHGIIVYALDETTQFLEIASVTRVIFAAADARVFGPLAWDAKYRKATASFQDLTALALFAFAAACVARGWRRAGDAPGWVKGIAVYLLADMALFYVRVLWFDDLMVGRSPEHLQVWSQRRLMFQAIGNFIESLALFTVFYRKYLQAGGQDRFTHALSVSFSTAVCLGRDDRAPDACRHVVNSQLVVALFFLVIVISVVGSQVYGRGQIAPSAAPVMSTISGP
jgi:hypothetical protein